MAQYRSTDPRPIDLAEAIAKRWHWRINVICNVELSQCIVECDADNLTELCRWLVSEMDYDFASLVVEEAADVWLIRYVFHGDVTSELVHLRMSQNKAERTVPSISTILHAADWHEREARDLFGLEFAGHPRPGRFVLHEEWPEDLHPLRKDFDAGKAYPRRGDGRSWEPRSLVQAPGVFMMPIGPVYSDTAESGLFLLESVGEDVIRSTPRFFYKFRGVEKIAEGRPVDRVLLLAERFTGTSSFAHSLAFCQAVEAICGIEVPRRGKALRVIFAELERFRHHIAAICRICKSTALAVATSQAGMIEEEAIRLGCSMTGHRYLFGLNVIGGVSLDLELTQCEAYSKGAEIIFQDLERLFKMLRYCSSFLDRLEQVGIVTRQQARSYCLVGPIARASGIARDLRTTLPYACYDELRLNVPKEDEGDGYARLRILFREAEESMKILKTLLASLPKGEIAAPQVALTPGSALGWAEAPLGATFHWVRIDDEGLVTRYHPTTPSFVNWHGFHHAAEGFAYQDFPIIMATFGLSNAECDR
jgi:formate hydrogenlyase subunit 5